MTSRASATIVRPRKIDTAHRLAVCFGTCACLVAAGGGECINSIYGTGSMARNFVASLDGASERPTPANTTATGMGTFTLNDAEDMLAYDISVSGLTGDVTDAHFHFSASGADGFGSFMLPGGTDGTITPNVVNDGSGGATAQGALAVNSQDVANLRINYLYVNFHTAQFPSGEVRGNIVPAP
jgi:hypothetical protein